MVGTMARRAVAAAALGICTILANPAHAQQTLSDRSVKVLMGYAWSVLPEKFTTETGKVIVVDKSDRKSVAVTVEVARDVVLAARLSAHAQVCNLPDFQTMNFRAMMRHEKRRKKWSDQELLYISQLHLFTILWLTGNVQVTQDDGEQNVAVQAQPKRKKPTCTDPERENVKKRINAYIKRILAEK